MATHPEDIVWVVARQDLEDRAGRRLAPFELSNLADAIGNSSIPEALDEIVRHVIGDPEEE